MAIAKERYMSSPDQGLQAAKDKSHFYYGSLYNVLLDPLIKPARKIIVNRVPQDSYVLDIGCGTGLLCFDLQREKNCRVVGIDLSRRMLDFARAKNQFDEVKFLHQDATDMQALRDGSFDYVVVLNTIHELIPEMQLRLLREALRVGCNILLFDSFVPLPWNATGLVKRFIEISFGIDHYPQFRSHIASGGIDGILETAGYADKIVERSTFSQGCNQLVIVSR